MQYDREGRSDGLAPWPEDDRVRGEQGQEADGEGGAQRAAGMGAETAQPALALATLLSCHAAPVPTSLMTLAAGAFVASGDGSGAGAGGGARLLAQAEGMVAPRSALTMFLSRWLFSPLGLHVNLLAGAAGMGWARFSLMFAAGAAVWVPVRVGLGVALDGQLAVVAGLLADSVGLLTSALPATLAGLALLRRPAAGQARRNRAGRPFRRGDPIAGDIQ